MKIKEFTKWLKANIKGEVEISKIDIVGNKIKITYMLPYNSFEFDFEKETDKEKREWKALFRFLYTSGLRVGELNNIEILTNKTIRIFGKGKKYRVCFYSKKSYDACKNIIGKYTGKTIRLKCKEILGQDYTPHNLRRSYATYLLKNGANPKMVQKTMGHANIKTTYRYFHNTVEELQDEYEKYFKG